MDHYSMLTTCYHTIAHTHTQTQSLTLAKFHFYFRSIGKFRAISTFCLTLSIRSSFAISFTFALAHNISLSHSLFRTETTGSLVCQRSDNGLKNVSPLQGAQFRDPFLSLSLSLTSKRMRATLLLRNERVTL